MSHVEGVPYYVTHPMMHLTPVNRQMAMKTLPSRNFVCGMLIVVGFKTMHCIHGRFVERHQICVMSWILPVFGIMNINEDEI